MATGKRWVSNLVIQHTLTCIHYVSITPALIYTCTSQPCCHERDLLVRHSFLLVSIWVEMIGKFHSFNWVILFCYWIWSHGSSYFNISCCAVCHFPVHFSNMLSNEVVCITIVLLLWKCFNNNNNKNIKNKNNNNINHLRRNQC